MALLGCFILAFGWFGFNAGSTLAGTDLRIAVIATNTMLASAAGAFAAMLYAWKKYGKPDPALAANGLLAGMVAITAPCAFVNSVSAVIIGLIAGVLLVWGVSFVERSLKIDDPVGAITVHGLNGAWGVFSLGLFADGTYGDAFNGVSGTVRGLFYGDPGQLVAQSVGIVANVAWVFAVSYGVMKGIGALVGNRVPAEVEMQGLDLPEMGVPAYPDYVTSDASSRELWQTLSKSRSRFRILAWRRRRHTDRFSKDIIPAPGKPLPGAGLRSISLVQGFSQEAVRKAPRKIPGALYPDGRILMIKFSAFPSVRRLLISCLISLIVFSFIAIKTTAGTSRVEGSVAVETATAPPQVTHTSPIGRILFPW